MTQQRKSGLIALSPLAVFLTLYLLSGIIYSDFYRTPVVVVFLITCIYALATTRALSVDKRIEIFSTGAGRSGMMLMLWIFVLAGAFASSAKEMGAIETTVNLTLQILPDNLLMAGIFLAACFISLSIGTSVGTIVALTPIAVGVAEKTGANLPLLVAIVVGGAYFGDNLSFISDTTIAATRSQGCRLNDKFKVNVQIVIPAALITLLFYILLGSPHSYSPESASEQWIKAIPYLVVLATAITGINVLLVLTLGLLLTGTIGLFNGDFTLLSWFDAMGKGIMSMSELIIVTLLAGGLMEIIKHNGGIVYIIEKLTHKIASKRGGELCIGLLVSLANICTANNTVAIITVGPLAREIATKFQIDARKSASLLDTFSCITQSYLPYGAQMLMAAGLASLNPFEIIPYLYYPAIMGIAVLLSILLRYPKKYS